MLSERSAPARVRLLPETRWCARSRWRLDSRRLRNGRRSSRAETARRRSNQKLRPPGCAQPAIECERRFDRFAIAHKAHLDLLLTRVGSVRMNAVPILDQKTDDRIVHVRMESRQDSQRQGFARFDNLDGATFRVKQFRAHNFCAAVAMPERVANGSHRPGRN